MAAGKSSKRTTAAAESGRLRFLEGGGEMGALMRALDWSQTLLSDPQTWPQPLRTAVRLMLNTGHPMYIFWGPQGACLYNDAYRRSIGPERHPGSLGQPAEQVWQEIWEVIGPQIRQVMAGGPATWHVDHLVPITRHGRREDVYWTYSYGPIDDRDAPSGVGGVLVVCTETTASVEAQQRQAFQIELEDRLRGLIDPEEIMATAAQALGVHMATDRCGYGEIDETGQFVTIWRDWTSGAVPTVAGRYRLDNYGPEIVASLRRGDPIQIEDTESDPRTGDSKDAYAASEVRALLSVPLVKEGQLVAALFAHQATPRPWTDGNLELARSVAQRTWAALERARAERALRENEARQALLLVLGDETRALSDANAIMDLCSRIVGQGMSVDRAGCAEADGDSGGFIVRAEWSAEGAAGPSRLEGIGPELMELVREGRPLVMNDLADPPPPGAAAIARALAEGGAGAALFCPFVRSGRLDGAIYLISHQPRTWTSAEANLVREIAARSSAAVRRARAETASREAAAELRFALEVGRFGAWTLDPVSRTLKAAETFRHCFGLEPEGTLTTGDVLAAVHPDDRERVAQALEQTAAGGAELDVEFRTGPADGTPRWLTLRGRASDGGAPRRVIGVVQDVTRERMAEARRQALIELSDRFRDADDTADLAYASAEIMGRALGVTRAGYGTVDTAAETIEIERDWNAPGVRSVAGTHRFRAYGSYIEDLTRGETVVIADAEKDPRADAAALRKIGIQSIVNMPVTEQGGLVAMLYLNHSRPREWSDEELDFVRDVAERTRTAIERRRAELGLRDSAALLEHQVERRTEELRASQARLRAIFETSFVYQGLLALDGTLLAANATSLQGIGATLSEVLGKKFWDTPWFASTAGAAEMVREAIPQVAAGSPVRREVKLCFPDGWHWFDFQMRPMRDETGEIVAIVPEAVEITSRHKAEEQLRQVQKMEAIGNLTGGLAHDFNNLLQVVGGNLQLLGSAVENNDRGRRLLRNAMEGVSRGSKLVSQLLAFGRRQPLAPKVVNLGRLVRGMENMLRRTLGEEIDISIFLGENLWNSRVDPSQVENALLNLGINARDAMEGGGSLTIRVRNLSVRPGSEEDLPPGDYVALSVEDTGAGMAPEVIEQAFEPFFTTKADGRGTGLGLSMVYGFVKQSLGHVQLDSTVGQGTTITLILPRALEEEEDAGADEALPGIGGTETVLVVEDDRPVRETAVETLRELGYTVLEAADGSEALEIVQGGAQIDLLFSDVVMPGPLRGPELAERVQTLLPRVGVLLTSGYVGHEARKEGSLADGADLLSKPYSREMLARKVRSVLQARLRPQAEASASVPAAPAARASGAPPTVLLVEDEFLIAVATSTMLQDAGYAVLSAGRGAEALALLEEREVDVLVADLGLPDMPGVELATRAVRLRPGLRVVFASGRNLGDELSGHPELADAGRLLKPYTPQQLSRVLAEALGRQAV